MRIALVRWREIVEDGHTSFVPDVDLDAFESWGVIDLRGTSEDRQTSADGLGLFVAPGAERAIAGSVVDLGDDPKARVGSVVASRLANRLGLNLVEAAPGRVAAELLTLHASEKDPSKPNPLVGERRFPRSRTDLRRRQRVWCAGVLLFDELGTFVDEEAVYLTESFPNVGNVGTVGQDIAWNSWSGRSLRVDAPGVVTPQVTNANHVGNRIGVDVGGNDHFAEVVVVQVDEGYPIVGPLARMQQSTITDCYGAVLNAPDGNDTITGGLSSPRLLRFTGSSNSSFVSLAATPFTVVPDQAYTVRLEANGSTLSMLIDGTPIMSNTDTSYPTSQRTGIMSRRTGGSPISPTVTSFATGLIGEGPGGDPPGEGSFTAYDTVLVSVEGDAPAVPAAEGQFTAHATDTATTAGGRDSSGTATVVDETTAVWAGAAPAVDTAEGQFTAVDEATVTAAGERASTGTATAQATDTVSAVGARDSTGAASLVDETRVSWSSSTVPEGSFTAVDETTVNAAGARASEGTGTASDTVHVAWTGSAPVVGGASGTFTAYDHTTVTVEGARDSTGTATAHATDTVAVTGARDSEGTVTAQDTTHAGWVGQASELTVPTGQFVMYDHVHVDTTGERASTGAATVHDHTHAETAGARPSRGFCTAHDTTTVRWSAPTTLPDLRERHTGRRPDPALSGRRSST